MLKMYLFENIDSLNKGLEVIAEKRLRVLNVTTRVWRSGWGREIEKFYVLVDTEAKERFAK